MSDGTVQRYDLQLYADDGEMVPAETGDYVRSLDHKALVDALRTQARDLASELLKYQKAMDGIYNQSVNARAAVVKHYGLHHNLAVIEQAQAVLNQERRAMTDHATRARADAIITGFDALVDRIAAALAQAAYPRKTVDGWAALGCWKGKP